MCSMPLTVVVAARSNCEVMRPSISAGGSPVYCQMAATTGMLICGNMSAGMRRMVVTPISTMSIASTMKVYGLRRARRTIHIGYAPQTFRTCAREWVRSFHGPCQSGFEENQACTPRDRGHGDRSPTGDLIAHCTVACSRLVNEGARRGHSGSLFRTSKIDRARAKPGPGRRLLFRDDPYAFETVACSALAISR